jgi:hypothetical protein
MAADTSDVEYKPLGVTMTTRFVGKNYTMEERKHPHLLSYIRKWLNARGKDVTSEEEV